MSTDEEQMKRLLAYANYRKVGDALGVSRATVSEWARGNDVNPARLRQVRSLMRGTLGETQKKPAPASAGTGVPPWVSRLEAKMDAIAASQRIVADEAIDRAIAALAPASSLEQAAALNRRLEELLRLRASDTPAESAGADPGEAGPQVPQAE